MTLKPLLARLQRLLPAGELRLEPSFCAKYSGDKWFAAHPPDAVALPRATASVSAVLGFAHEHRVPLTARGAGYGYVGGCVPNLGGIVVSLERMKRIKEINADDFVAVVQPGVLTKTLQDAVERRASKWCLPTARSSGLAGGRTKTKRASICTGCLSGRKGCSASSPRRR
jgi:glycolate oxidase